MRRTTTFSILAGTLLVLGGCGSAGTPGPGAPGPENTPVEPLPGGTAETPGEPADPRPPVVQPGDPDDPPDEDPDRIYADVRDALNRSGDLDASEIEIWVDRDTVYLSGFVKTPEERDAALAAAEAVPGVGRVYGTGLQVRGA